MSDKNSAIHRIRADYIYNGAMALKKLISGSSKFDVNLFWKLFDYSKAIYEAYEKISKIRVDILANSGTNSDKAAKLVKLSEKLVDVPIDKPVIKRSQIDLSKVTPDDLIMLVNNELICIDNDNDNDTKVSKDGGDRSKVD